MRTPILASLMIAAAAACGGGGGGDPADARPNADAAPQAVQMVTCSGTPPLITTVGNSYSPMSVQIAPGEMVQFMLGSTHNVVSTTAGQTFSLGFGANACLQFDIAGTFTFKCGPHNFTGSVVVQ
jgi:plastocyanin